MSSNLTFHHATFRMVRRNFSTDKTFVDDVIPPHMQRQLTMSAAQFARKNAAAGVNFRNSANSPLSQRRRHAQEKVSFSS